MGYLASHFKFKYYVHTSLKRGRYITSLIYIFKHQLAE